jgi:uncharacterized protein YcfJ
MRNTMIPGLVAVTVLAVPVAQAHDDDDYDGYGTTAYAEVLRAEPVTHLVEVTTPRQECWNEEVRHVVHEHPYTTGQTILGGVIGAAIGHEIGRGRGRDAATIAGGLIGASVGANHAARSGDSYERVGTERRCRTVEERHTEERTDGYDVTYRYGGETYHTRMPYDPGRRLRVQVNVSPAEG